MIGAHFTDEVSAQLRARRFPVDFSYGERRLDRAMPSPGRLEVDVGDGADVYSETIAMRGLTARAGEMRAVTTLTLVIRGASSKAGARHRDHRGLVRALVDTLVLEARLWAHRRGLLMPSAMGSFVDPPDTQLQHGAEYELSLDFARGVEALNEAPIDGLLLDGTDHELSGEGTVLYHAHNDTAVLDEPEPEPEPDPIPDP